SSLSGSHGVTASSSRTSSSNLSPAGDPPSERPRGRDHAETSTERQASPSVLQREAADEQARSREAAASDGEGRAPIRRQGAQALEVAGRARGRDALRFACPSPWKP